MFPLKIVIFPLKFWFAKESSVCLIIIAIPTLYEYKQYSYLNIIQHHNIALLNGFLGFRLQGLGILLLAWSSLQAFVHAFPALGRRKMGKIAGGGAGTMGTCWENLGKP